VDRDTNHDLIGTKADGAHSIHEREEGSAADAREHPNPRAVAVVATERGTEGAAKHVSLERQSDESRALRHDAACRGEQIWNGDAQRLREEQESRHQARFRCARIIWRTSGTETATAMITTA